MTSNDQDRAALRALQDENDRLKAENEDLLETQRLLESTRQQFSELFDHAPMPWITVDAAGTIENLNLAAVALVGVGRAQLVGSSLSTSIHPDDRQRLRAHLSTASGKGTVELCDLRLASRNAIPIPVQLSIRHTGAENGSLALAVLDLSERHAADTERKRLAQAEREARAASDAKDTFIAILSRELRTPLTPVLAATSALSDFQDLPEDLQNALAIIRRNVATEVQLIDDLLDLTRITHGKMRLNEQPIDLHQVARDAASAALPSARLAQLELTLDLQALHYWVTGDPIRMQQVFDNLLRNAIEVTPAGGRIEIRSWNHDDLLLVEVSDDGKGIAPDTLGRMFQPFEQEFQEPMAIEKGLGLGLLICRGILLQHGAAIAASSPGLGRGARFVVEIGTIDPPTVRPRAELAARLPP